MTNSSSGNALKIPNDILLHSVKASETTQLDISKVNLQEDFKRFYIFKVNKANYLSFN